VSVIVSWCGIKPEQNSKENSKETSKETQKKTKQDE
jgi:hypothetical protein